MTCLSEIVAPRALKCRFLGRCHRFSLGILEIALRDPLNYRHVIKNISPRDVTHE